MELVTLSSKELRRLEVLQALLTGTLRQAEAAGILGLSVRHVKRLLRRFRSAGAVGLASARRGRPPNNALDPVIKAHALELYRTRYEGFGPTLAAEKLRERDRIDVSRETLRKWLMSQQLWRAGKRRPHPRPPRARRSCFGELVQIDGSPHAWFEDRGPRCTLLLAVDDATGCIGAAQFARAETTNAYFDLFEQYFSRHGLPEAFYSDRHSIFRINTPLVEDRQTQVARALEELDIELICANSPQAKGRVERANRTLQDRLLKEMRLHGICDIETANQFLPHFCDDYNQRFAKMPASTFDAHRTTKPFELQRILAQRFERTLTANLTLQIGHAIYALVDQYSQRVLRGGVRVQLHHRRDGTLTLTHNGRQLQYQLVQQIVRNAAIVGAKDLAERPPKVRTMPQMARTPKPSHPWKTLRLKPPRDISALRSGDINALR
jgi:transposase